MKTIFFTIILIVCSLSSYGKTTYVRIKEDVLVTFDGKQFTLFKDEILEKNAEGKLLFFGKPLETVVEKTVDVPLNEIDTLMWNSINNLAQNDNIYKIFKDESGQISLEIDLTGNVKNISEFIFFPQAGEKTILKTNKPIISKFEDFSYKYVRFSVINKKGKICISTIFIDTNKFNLLLSDNVADIIPKGWKTGIGSLINPKWRDIFNLDSKKKETEIPNEIVKPNMAKSFLLKNLIFIIIVVVLSLACIAFYILFFKRRIHNDDTNTSNGDGATHNKNQKKQNRNLNEKSQENVASGTINSIYRTKDIPSEPYINMTILEKMSGNIEDLRKLVIKIQQDMNLNDTSLKKENEKIKEELKNKELELKELTKLFDENKSQINILNAKLDSSNPKGIFYLGDCSEFVEPNERFLMSLLECEKRILTFINSIKITNDALILNGMVGKFYIDRPSEDISRWLAILENLKINGLIVDSIKNDLTNF